MNGIDYSWARPDLRAAAADGVKFVARYLSYDNSKNLSISERDLALSLGMEIVLVWETTANRALSGYEGGRMDAVEAANQSRALGIVGRPIYFAVDWDASEGEQGVINDYLLGAGASIGKARIGIYGGYWPVKRCLDSGIVKYAWQTYAWSGGNIDPRIHIYQYENGVNRYGGNIDLNISRMDDYGQYPYSVDKEEDLGYFRETIEPKREGISCKASFFHDHVKEEGFRDWINIRLTKGATIKIVSNRGKTLFEESRGPGDHNFHFPGYRGYVDVEIFDVNAVIERSGTYRP